MSTYLHLNQKAKNENNKKPKNNKTYAIKVEDKNLLISKNI